MTNILQAKNVRVEFGSTIAVRDLSFDLAGGQLLGLVGPNGAGKTTLLRVLAGLQAPTCGAGYVMGKPVLGKHEVVRHHIGFAPDSPPVYEELTVEQFLRFIGLAYGLNIEETNERIDYWLEQLWLTDKRTSEIKKLSRGMRQRITLARTFLPKPHVLLLDEPLAGLDPAGRIQLRSVLTMLSNQGCAMIVSSHILSDLEEVATHIAIIEQGSIIRWAETKAMYDTDEHRRTYSITTLDNHASHIAKLESIEGVTNVAVDGRTYTLDYHAGDEHAANLLKHITQHSISVCAFSVVKTTLEQVYLKAGVRQVD